MKVFAWVLAVFSAIAILGILAAPAGDGSDMWGVIYAVATIVVSWAYIKLVDKK